MYTTPGAGSPLRQPITATSTGFPEAADLARSLSIESTCSALTTPTQAKEKLFMEISEAFEKSPDVARILHGDRHIEQGGRGRRTALFPSRKCGGHIPVESQLELAYAVALERSPLVLDYRTQAIRIPLPGGRFAHPDFLIRTIHGTFEVHEVKPSVEHLSVESLQRFAAIQALLGVLSIAFRIVDARELLSGLGLQELLNQYSRGHMQVFSRHQIELGLSVLRDHKVSSFVEAYRRLREQDLPAQLADYLHFHQRWTSDAFNNSTFQGAAQ
jgi:hypothetical protein